MRISVEDFAKVGPGFHPKSKAMKDFAKLFPNGMEMTAENILALGEKGFRVDDITDYLASYESREAIYAGRRALWEFVNAMAPIGHPAREEAYQDYQIGIAGDMAEVFEMRPSFDREYYAEAKERASTEGDQK